MGNSLQNNVRCDQRDLNPGWYRFTGAAGDKMPTECVPVRRCGTHAPGWLSGAHPTLAEGAVARKVCYHWTGRCCQWSNNIKIRNCGGFFVYELQKTPVCSLRYCGNKQGERWYCFIRDKFVLRRLISVPFHYYCKDC